MNPIEGMQKVMVALSKRAEAAEGTKVTRKAMAMLIRTLRATPEARDERLDGLRGAAAVHADEVATWVGPNALLRGEGGAFDACDLRHWIVLAHRAGVPAIKAREILRLDEAEMSLASGEVPLPRAPLGEVAKPVLDDAVLVGAIGEVVSAVADATGGPLRAVDPEALADKLASAMDDVPEGWMVRSARCGSSTLKALSGFGLAGPVVPEVRFSSDLEIGPGWVRRGNRRSVDAGDFRTVESYAHGPGGELSFLARPWAPPARLIRCEDPHRSGTRVAGPGWWPLELRAFVVDGVVEGVSNYFSWATFEATPENARVMLEARRLAQLVADEAVRQKAHPRYMDLEFVRGSGHPQITDDERMVALLDEYGRDKVAFTIDFLEVATPDGPRLVMIEAGPAAGPMGGGHPCGFAGVGGRPRKMTRPGTRGAAFQSMEHIVIADLDTWVEGDATGRILSWDEVEALATSDEPATAGEGVVR